MVATAQDVCTLSHPLFARLGEIMFRRSQTDGTPVMIMSLGDRDAAVPIRSLQREFDIADDSPDGRMLGLIAESLDFVCGLRLGDRLPAEVLTGRASWTPEDWYRHIAMRKLRLQLVTWFDPQGGWGDDAAALDRIESDPAAVAQGQRACEAAARTLGLPNTEAVLELVSGIAEEMSFIEALREELLVPVHGMAQRLNTLTVGRQVNIERRAMLIRVRSLAQRAVQQLSARFIDVDAQTGEVIATLRNAEAQRNFIRSNRDWLYRTRRAWEPILAEWSDAPVTMNNNAWHLIRLAYQFLAPRFMPVQEWEASLTSRQSRKPPAPQSMMRW